MTGETWLALSAVVVAVIGIPGSWLAGRQSTKAAQISASPEERRVDIEGLTALVRSLQDELGRAAERISDLEAWKAARERADVERDRLIREHIPWDDRAMAALQAAGAPIGTPPPLTA